jgi:hypothetical protein
MMDFCKPSLAAEQGEDVVALLNSYRKQESTYTEALPAGIEDADDVAAFLSNHQLDAKIQEVLTKYPDSVGALYHKLVSSGRVTHDDFWLRYVYRCNVERALQEWMRNRQAQERNPLQQAIGNFQKWNQEQQRRQKPQHQEGVGDKNNQDKNPFETVVTTIQKFFDDLQKKDNDKSKDKEMPCIVQERPAQEGEAADKPRDLLCTSFDTLDISLIEDVDDDVDFTSRYLDMTFDTIDTRVAAPYTDDSSDAMNSLLGNNSNTIMNEKDLVSMAPSTTITKDMLVTTKPSKTNEMGYGQFLFSALCLLVVVMTALAISPPESTRELFSCHVG